MMASDYLKKSPLGKDVEYIDQYDASLLCPIPRAKIWQKKGYSSLPFKGCDIWNAYEISWLNQKGLPQVAMAEFSVPCSSPNLTESKSFKLYLNSFNQTRFDHFEQIQNILQKDLSVCVCDTVTVDLFSLGKPQTKVKIFGGVSLDELDIEITTYHPSEKLLQINLQSDAEVHEQLFSHLLKSNCPITGQPDWASLYIEYLGQAIDHESLLKYIVSFRKHSGFHEQCVETIFLDILQQCQPTELTVYARYVRRGGLDINPYRTTTDRPAENIRLIRQ